GVQTCALPICCGHHRGSDPRPPSTPSRPGDGREDSGRSHPHPHDPATLVAHLPEHRLDLLCGKELLHQVLRPDPPVPVPFDELDVIHPDRVLPIADRHGVDPLALDHAEIEDQIGLLTADLDLTACHHGVLLSFLLKTSIPPRSGKVKDPSEEGSMIMISGSGSAGSGESATSPWRWRPESPPSC